MDLKNLQANITRKLLDSPTPVKLKLFSKILNQVIPFNSPHGFVFEKVDPLETCLRLPLKRSNQNHLGGIHACAIATLGEYSAGALFLKNFGISEYRIILEEIKCQYHSQGRTSLLGRAKISKTMLAKKLKELDEEGVCQFQLTTEISDENDKHVATVKSKWQLKDWRKVRKPK